MSDFDYICDGEWIKFFPNNAEAERCYNDWCRDNGMPGMMFLLCFKDKALRELRRAGYSVHKAKPVEWSDIDLSELVE